MIDFTGTDLILERPAAHDRVRTALASALGVPEHRVVVIDDVSDYPDRATADVVCVASPVEGDFVTLLSVQVPPVRLPFDAPLGPAQRVCDLLAIRCLVPDESTNPYRMWLLMPRQPAAIATLDPAALDEGRFVLQR